MMLDIKRFSPAARAKQIALGRRYSWRDVLDQANQTLTALAAHGPKLMLYSFNQADGQRLVGARDLLILAGVDRAAARGGKMAGTRASSDAMVPARDARLWARTILEAVEQELEEEGLIAAAREVTTMLQQTAVAGDSPEELAKQLDLSTRMLENSAVLPLATARGGAEVLQELARTTAALRQSQLDAATRPGTAEETQYLDQIDGIIIQLVRRARKAARAAGRALKDPALAKAFKLDRIYRRRNGNDAPSEQPADSTTAEPATSATAQSGSTNAA